MLKGKQSWIFQNRPMIAATGTVGGPFENNGNLAQDFDMFFEDLWLGEDSYEKAQRMLMQHAMDIALKKGKIDKSDVQFLFAGDLINQMTPTSFAAKTIEIPYFGIFGACSTSMEGLALSAFIINYGGANFVLTGTSSHNAATERQYRYPTEYGGQKPPTAQWTVTGAGCALLKSNFGEKGVPVVTSATVGKVIDLGMTDPFNMGGAMAPAAVDTIVSHFNDLNIDASYYDLIVTGDLGQIGHESSFELLKKEGVNIDKNQYKDCGLMIYKDNQPVQAGASGAACSAVVLYGHLLNKMKEGVYKRILCVATGALLSPLTFQQKETVPCIAHAVSIEMND